MIELLTTPEAASYLGITPRKMERLRLAGEIPYLPHSPILYDRTDVEELKRRCPNASVLDKLLKPRPTQEQAEKWARIAILLRRR